MSLRGSFSSWECSSGNTGCHSLVDRGAGRGFFACLRQQNTSFLHFQFQTLAPSQFEDIAFFGDGQADARLPLASLKVVAAFGVDFDLAADAHPVLQFSIGFDDGGEEIPSAIDLDLLDDVYSVGRTATSGDSRHGWQLL